jgi:hypothetical protein
LTSPSSATGSGTSVIGQRRHSDGPPPRAQGRPDQVFRRGLGSETVVCGWFVAREAIAAASGGPSSAISRRQNLEIALLRSVIQRLPLLQQHHAVQCQVERSIAAYRVNLARFSVRGLPCPDSLQL